MAETGVSSERSPMSLSGSGHQKVVLLVQGITVMGRAFPGSIIRADIFKRDWGTGCCNSFHAYSIQYICPKS